jgi:exodeoxyribonuclease VII small subunit
MSDNKFSPVELLSYEEALTELEEIVRSLENGQETLEESMAAFERGQALVQHCTALLEKAALQVRMLSGEDVPIVDEEKEA